MIRDELTERIIGAAICVHRVLGPGLDEGIYEACLEYELREAGLRTQRQVHLPVRYGVVLVEKAYRLDVLVEEEVIVELKTVEKLLPVHKAQVLTYMKLSKISKGLLMNFNVELLKDGLFRLELVQSLNKPKAQKVEIRLAPGATERDELTGAVIAAAIEVHRVLGPGLLKEVYAACLEYEFNVRQIPHQRQVSIPVNYGPIQLAHACSVDFVIADSLVLEVKAVEELLAVQKAQTLARMKLAGASRGLLLNFNVALLKDGIFRLGASQPSSSSSSPLCDL